jgi:uncharacterized protein YjgD (DUF1641 family)
MSNNVLKGPSSGEPSDAAQRMAVQIDEIHGRLAVIEGLMADLSPALEKIPREIGETLNALRQRYERDETVELLKKIGDNIPTFIQMLSMMEAVKGLVEDVAPAMDKIVHEITPAVNGLRYAFERDETLVLMRKMGESMPDFIKMMSVMEAVKGLMEDAAPALGSIVHEITPVVNRLRYAFEKDELVDLMEKTGQNMGSFIKMLDFLHRFDAEGGLDFALNAAVTKETEYMIRGMEKCAVRTMKQLIEEPLKPGMMSIFSQMKNPEVQKGLLLMTTFAKNMPQCMLETVQENADKILEQQAEK